MRIADCTTKERQRIDEIKRDLKYLDDHTLIRDALTKLTGGRPVAPLLDGAPADVDEADRPVRQIVDLWNVTRTAPIPAVNRLTTALAGKIRSRLKDFGHKTALFEMAFKEIQLTPWCRGEGNRSWTIDLSWLMAKEDRVQKFIDLAVARKGKSSRVPSCRHQPPCTDPSACTERMLRETR